MFYQQIHLVTKIIQNFKKKMDQTAHQQSLSSKGSNFYQELKKSMPKSFPKVIVCQFTTVY